MGVTKSGKGRRKIGKKRRLSLRKRDKKK